MEALRETTVWSTPGAVNHTYLIDGMNLVAMIRNGETVPRFFKNPIRGFSKTGRKFVRVDISLFGKKRNSTQIEVQGSGGTYLVDKEAGTCTCPGFAFRRSCKHLIAL
jgi:hypothetical protein